MLTLMLIFLLYSYCAVQPYGRKLKVYKYTEPLIGTPEPLPETGVLANHNSDLSLVKRTASQPAEHTDLFMEVAPRPKKRQLLLSCIII